jgi:GT2 family glycosyltransferase
MGNPTISVIIPNWNGAAYLERCLLSLETQTCPPREIIVVDNASRDGSVEIALRVSPHLTLVRKKSNLGFAAAVNAGVQVAQGEWAAVLNNDTEVAPTWLAECAAAIQRHPDCSFLACRIFEHSRGQRIFSAGDCFLRAGIGYRRGQELDTRAEFDSECDIFSASGCAALYRLTTLRAAGGYDEDFFAYLEDVDLGLRLKASGATGIYAPAALVYHHGGATSGGEFSPLGVRLRTRNSILLLLKSIPGKILWRSLPMIAAAQISWLLRVAAHRRFFSYARGIAGVVPLIPAMWRARRKLRPAWRESRERLWKQILVSERMASHDYTDAPGGSRFLKWYFDFFAC